MRPFLSILFLFLFLAAGAEAQSMKGIVLDGANSKPLYLVTVVNLTTHEATATDDLGRYQINAKSGETIAFSYIGYKTIERLASPGGVLNIELFYATIELKDYVIHNYTPYQLDSIQLADLYNKQLNDARIKPKTAMNAGVGTVGIGVDGLVSSFAQKVSRKYKRDKKFKANFKADEEQKYIDTRYTPDVVTAVTGLTGDTINTFINGYPMEYAFARAATELELKMWIRDNYKDYLRKQKD